MIFNKITFAFSFVLILFLFACNSNNSNESKKKTTIKKETPLEKKASKIILFFGNSLTAGYGLEPEEAYPALIQNKLDSLGYDYTVVNAGVSGETTASGNSRVDWVLQQQKIDIFVLELGGNDGLRGIPTSETEENLKSIIDKVQKNAPDAKFILSGMMVPPNMGPQYSEDFNKVFPKVAADKKVYFLPFLLDGVAGETELNQEDGIHPTAKGQQIVADNVWQVLKPLL